MRHGSSKTNKPNKGDLSQRNCNTATIKPLMQGMPKIYINHA